MALTPDLVARVERARVDPGPDPILGYHDDQDYEALVKSLLSTRPDGPDTWLFAYGSLIWRPEIVHVATRKGTARGWHRSFCFRVERFRGTKEEPGLMMSLDRGGQCQGMLLKLAPEGLESQLSRLLRREITIKPPNNLPKWIAVESADGPVRALAFVMNRHSRFYCGKLTPEEIAGVLASAGGHWGSCAEYLCNPVGHLEAHGIRDRNLWRLQELVAERIRRLSPIL